ncbi:MAG: anti-sigma factor [Parvibaculaceae bacterium]
MNRRNMECPEFSDETLVAFADGELADSDASVLRDALENDPALKKRLEVFVATRDRLRADFGSVVNEPVPDRLTELVMSQGMTRGNERHRRGRHDIPRLSVSRFAGSMAAAVACLVAGLGGFLIGSQTVRDTGSGLVSLTASAEPELQRLLATGADGAVASWSAGNHGGEITLEGTYRTRAGLCRSFSVSERTGTASRAEGIACLDANAWRTRMVAARDAADGTMTPATGAGQAVDAFLDAAEAGDPLDAATVRELIEKDWK